MPVPAFATIGESIGAFVDATEQFFANIAAISWPALAIALSLHGLHLTLRTRAWFNALRAAYPRARIQWRTIWAAEITGAGANSVLPAHAGAALRLYLAKTSIRDSSYPAVGSSFLVESVFDSTLGVCVLIYGLTQGVFPRLPDLSRLPAFDLAYFAAHPQFTVFLLTLLPIVALAVFALLAVRVKAFWAHVRQGLAVLGDRRRYMRSVVTPQFAGWICRAASIWFLLEAFNIGGSVGNVLIVLAVQAAATMVPLTPQGAGVQQALLVAAFTGAAAGATVAAYSVGQQVALAAFNVAFGFLALGLVFRTTQWRSLIAIGRAEQAADKAARKRTTGR